MYMSDKNIVFSCTISDPVLARIAGLWRRDALVPAHRAVSMAKTLLHGLDDLDPAAAKARLLLAGPLLRSALAIDPFYPELISFLDQFSRSADERPLPGLARRLRRLQALTADWPVAAQAYVDDSLDDGHPSVQLRHLLQLWRSRDWDAFTEKSNAWAEKPYGAAAAPLLAWGAFHAGQETLREQLLATADAAGTMDNLGLNLRAEIALESGDADAAKAFWAESLAAEPGQPHLAVRMHHGFSDAPTADLSSTVVCAQAHAKDIHGLLHVLQSTISEGCNIVLLIHGQRPDDEQSVRQAVADALGERSAELVVTPTPIGVPAARNWLASMEAAQQSKFLAFIDKPAVLPDNWLPLLVGVLETEPTAGAVASMHGAGPQFFEVSGEWAVRYAPSLGLDLGQHRLAAPCAGAESPCRVVRRTALEHAGAYDVRYTPEYGFDKDMDLRFWSSGRQCFCHGLVRPQVAGFSLDEQQLTACRGSMDIKLDLAHPPGRVDAAMRAALAAEKQFWTNAPQQARELLSSAALETVSVCLL